ncbi:P-loop containing nucleoside triphosphate hydrolase protein, partial [Mycena floridula]
FHGRESELEQIINALCSLEMPAQIAILGPGGIGRSALALAVVHATQIFTKYGQYRFWISCDSALSANDLITIVTNYFGIESRDFRVDGIVRHLSNLKQPLLLVLDNLETPWEATQLEVEEFLSHITGIARLSLIITMRGAERPGRVKWSRPFLKPLQPLSIAAAQEMFIEISDVSRSDPDLEELLQCTDYLPLAVSLMGSVAENEGCAVALSLWNSETTSLLSKGSDRRSNLEKSIKASLQSTRISSIPAAYELLGVLSLLPDGASDVEIGQMSLTFWSDYSRCKMALCRTSIAFITPDNRLKLLVPIREYALSSIPPTEASAQAVQTYFFDLARLGEDMYKSPSFMNKFMSNLGNIQLAIRRILDETDQIRLKAGLMSLFHLSTLYYIMQIGFFDMLAASEAAVRRLADAQVTGHFYLASFWTANDNETQEALCGQAIHWFTECDDFHGQGMNLVLH